ncbi:hypothetical protein HDV00_012087 [Rhizophlyctis rosea]|nr:hypothetical protein HDV00_012087 [Rhizophlyctis rosea]
MRQINIDFERLAGFRPSAADQFEEFEPHGPLPYLLGPRVMFPFDLPDLEYRLQTFKTRDSVLNAFRSILETIERRNHLDLYNMHAHLPFLCLRLNFDRACYGIVKWYAVAARTYDWVILPDDSFLTYIAPGYPLNPFEDVEFMDDGTDLNLLVAMTLVKLRMLLDMKDLVGGVSTPSTTMSTASVPQITYRSSILAFTPSPLETIQSYPIEQQVKALFDLVQRNNKHMWEVLLSPEEYLGWKTEEGKPAPAVGTLEDARATLNRSFDAWRETVGALEWVRGRVAGAVGDKLRIFGGWG